MYLHAIWFLEQKSQFVNVNLNYSQICRLSCTFLCDKRDASPSPFFPALASSGCCSRSRRREEGRLPPAQSHQLGSLSCLCTAGRFPADAKARSRYGGGDIHGWSLAGVAMPDAPRVRTLVWRWFLHELLSGVMPRLFPAAGCSGAGATQVMPARYRRCLRARLPALLNNVPERGKKNQSFGFFTNVSARDLGWDSHGVKPPAAKVPLPALCPAGGWSPPSPADAQLWCPCPSILVVHPAAEDTYFLFWDFFLVVSRQRSCPATHLLHPGPGPLFPEHTLCRSGRLKAAGGFLDSSIQSRKILLPCPLCQLQ